MTTIAEHKILQAAASVLHTPSDKIAPGGGSYDMGVIEVTVTLLGLDFEHTDTLVDYLHALQRLNAALYKSNIN